MDFTLKTYERLLKALKEAGYHFLTFEEYIILKNKEKTSEGSKGSKSEKKIVVLRHDVDNRPSQGLQMAIIENSIEVRGTYHFRMVPKCFNQDIILKISALGHEIGYHYETIAQTNRLLIRLKKYPQNPSDEHIDIAYNLFRENLQSFRKIVPISTISMHGSPLSPFDNRAIWKKYDYQELGILGEPFNDVDFQKMGYLTDTSRYWNGYRFNLRDKVKSPYSFGFISTYDIIRNIDKLPDQVMFNFHPQRWTDSSFLWVKEFVWQNIKNIGKWMLLKWRKMNEDG